MPHTPVESDREQRKKPQTIAAEIAANPNLFTVEAGSYVEGGFAITIYKSAEADRTVHPQKVHEKSGFQNIALAVRALTELMSEVVEVADTKFKDLHMRVLTHRLSKRATNYSIPLRDIMRAVR